MSNDTLNAIEHIIVALAAVASAYFAYRRGFRNGHSRAKEEAHDEES